MGIITSTALSLRDLQRSDNARFRLNRSPIENIQPGITVSLSSTTGTSAAFTAVDRNRSIIIYTGATVSGDTGPTDTSVLGYGWCFASDTTIYAARTSTVHAGTATLSFTIIEFTEGFIRSTYHNTATSFLMDSNHTYEDWTTGINIDDLDKAFVIFNGATGSAFDERMVKVSIYDENTIRATRQTSDSTGGLYMYFTLVEFY